MAMPRLLLLLCSAVGTGSRLSPQELKKAVYMAKKQLSLGQDYDKAIDSITSYFNMGVIDTYLLAQELEKGTQYANNQNLGRTKALSQSRA